MIKLDQKEATLRYTPRVELHGDDTEPGCTLNITMRGHNSLLNQFDESLVETFFKQPEDDEENLSDKATEFSILRFPMLQRKFTWDYKTSGYRVVISGGLNDESDLIFVQCDLTKFSFEIEEGGVITLKFNISCDPTAEEAGELYEINGSKVELTLEPPSPEQQAQMELDDAA